MKKYKLIKEYPGSPKLGHIIEVSPSSPSAQFIEGYWIYKIESSPEFWQKITKPCKDCEELMWTCSNCREITKPEYTILSFIKTSKDIYKLNEDNRYRKNDNIKSTIGFTVDEMLNQGGCVKSGLYSIHSVRRESDSSIWTINDMLQDKSCGDSPITKITLDGDGLLFHTQYGAAYIHQLVKVKQPLFTTEDGVDIYEGDTYYIINPKLNYLLTNHIAENGDNFYKTFIKFSTKEKAEEYIFYNKPILSLNDILEINGEKHAVRAKPLSVSKLYNELRKLVKQKLKQ